MKRQGRVSRKQWAVFFSIFKLTDGTYAYRIPNGFEKLFHAKLLYSVGGTNEMTESWTGMLRFLGKRTNH